MNILITPLIRNPRKDAAYFITQNLATLFANNNHHVAVSADNRNGFHQVSLYGAAKPKKPMTAAHPSLSSYEEWLYVNGALSESYLQEDLEYILEAILLFKPDLIITMDRLAAVIAAKMTHTRCFAIISSSIYKKKTFEANTVKGLNTFLANNKSEQVLHAYEVYRSAERRIVFGPFETEPFTDPSIDRIEMPFILPLTREKENHICVYLNDVRKNARSIRKTIDESFNGASYDVYVSTNDTRVTNDGNMHYIKLPKEDLIASAKCLIHDGNDYFFNTALAHGIPQIIVGASEYLRFANARSVHRCSFGAYLFDEEFNLTNLYETYRRVITDERIQKACKEMQTHVLTSNDLTKIESFL